MTEAPPLPLNDRVQRMGAVFSTADHPHALPMFDDRARTAQETAEALGITVGQIAKTIAASQRSNCSPMARPMAAMATLRASIGASVSVM